MKIDAAVLAAVRAELARRDLIDFVRYTMPTYQVSWHHAVICAALDRVTSGECKRLMIWAPPQHGKTELVSRRFPAYVLGKNPNKRIIATSYSADLAARINRDVQRVIDDDLYRALFPETRLNRENARTVAGNWLRNSDLFEVVGKRGYYRSAGVGGGITGMGFDVGLIDDPIKNAEEAYSQAYREKVFEWYTSTFYTRQGQGASIVIIMQRWHEDDLCGKLLQLQASDTAADKWEIVKLTGMREDDAPEYDTRKPGDALWEARYPLSHLERVRSSIGSRDWSALYQQRPSPASGGIFKRAWFGRRWKVAPECTEYLSSWDTSFVDSKASSFVVGEVWGVKGADKILLDQVRGRMDFTATRQAFRDQAAKWPQVRRKLVENKANGPAIIAELRREIPGIVPVEVKGSKEARAHASTPYFEAGNVVLPDASVAPWVNDYVEELVSFPNAPNDDQVDATTQALDFMARRGAPGILSLYEAKPSPRPSETA